MIKLLRKLVKLFDLPVLINKDFEGSIIVEYFLKKDRKLTIDLLPIFPLSNFVLYNKSIRLGKSYRYIEIEFTWLYIYYMYEVSSE